MSAAPILAKTIKYALTILGSNKRYSFDKPFITIGRGPENDISLLHDIRVSRTHVVIRSEQGQATIKNLSQKNPLFVNDKNETECLLPNNSLLLIGNTRLRFEIENLEQSKSFNLISQQNFNINAQYTPINSGSNQQSSPANEKNKILFYIIVGLSVLSFGYFYNEKNSEKQKIALRTDSDIEKDIQESALEVKKIIETKDKNGEKSINFKQAEESFLQGFRDYRQGQYGRAIESFQAALSSYPKYELAYKYKLEAERKFEALIDFDLQQGRRYLGKNNYRLCRASYANVMTKIKDTTNIKYREAKQGYTECTSKMEGHY